MNQNKTTTLFSQLLHRTLFVFSLIVMSFGLVQATHAQVIPVRGGNLTDQPRLTSLASTTSSFTYTSPIFTTQFHFNGFGITYTGKVDPSIQFYFKVDSGKWILASTTENNATQANTFSSDPMFFAGSQIQYRITANHPVTIQDVTINYFDSATPAAQRKLADTIAPTVPTTGPHIISRTDWGADPAYLHWTPQYQTPYKFIVHHTASTGDVSDGAAVVRGIYYYHAMVLDWGDIGYNYLIDQQGNIYEGRTGGDGVIGGHTYNSSNSTNYNPGSVGISLIGCFEDTPGKCSTVSTFNPTMEQTLEQLLAFKAATFTIDPLGSSLFINKTTQNIIGHRDVDYTYCPGSQVESKLDEIRQAVATLIQTGNFNPYQASLTSTTLNTNYTIDQLPTNATFTYHNAGTADWAAKTVTLRVSLAGVTHNQKIHLADLASSNTDTTFTVPWTFLPTKRGNYTVTAVLLHDHQIVSGSTITQSLTLTNPFQASVLTKPNFPSAIKTGWNPAITFMLQNSGTATWPAGTQVLYNKIAVITINHEVVPGQHYAQTFLLNSKNWPTNSVQHITFSLQTPSKITIQGSTIKQQIRVDR